MRYLLVSIDKTDKKEIVIPDEIIVSSKPPNNKFKKALPTPIAKKVQIAKPISK